MSISSHFKEQIILGNVNDLRAKRLTIQIAPVDQTRGNDGSEAWVIVTLDDGDGLPLRELGRARVSTKHDNNLHFEGFSNAFDVRLA